MTPSQQKLDIDNVRRDIHSLIEKLKQNDAILKRGMEAIDEGEDMMSDNSILAQEVRKIMKDPFVI